MVSQSEAEWKKSPSPKLEAQKERDAADAADADRGGSDEEALTQFMDLHKKVRRTNADPLLSTGILLKKSLPVFCKPAM